MTIRDLQGWSTGNYYRSFTGNYSRSSIGCSTRSSIEIFSRNSNMNSFRWQRISVEVTPGILPEILPEVSLGDSSGISFEKFSQRYRSSKTSFQSFSEGGPGISLDFFLRVSLRILPEIPLDIVPYRWFINVLRTRSIMLLGGPSSVTQEVCSKFYRK